jgi:hypothetical protein
MLKHGERHGKPVMAYTPRAPLSAILSAAHKMEDSQRQRQPQTAVHNATIEAREDDGSSDMEQKLLAATVRAD